MDVNKLAGWCLTATCVVKSKRAFNPSRLKALNNLSIQVCY